MSKRRDHTASNFEGCVFIGAFPGSKVGMYNVSGEYVVKGVTPAGRVSVCSAEDPSLVWGAAKPRRFYGVDETHEGGLSLGKKRLRAEEFLAALGLVKKTTASNVKGDSTFVVKDAGDKPVIWLEK